MNEIQKEALIGYLRNEEIDILSLTFLKSGNISGNELSVHYYRKEGSERFLTSDIISPNGEVKSTSVQSMR